MMTLGTQTQDRITEEINPKSDFHGQIWIDHASSFVQSHHKSCLIEKVDLIKSYYPHTIYQCREEVSKKYSAPKLP